MALNDYKIAVVTGASRGIGSALVRRLAKRGLEVHALVPSSEGLRSLEEETGCHAHAADVGDWDAVAAAIGGLEVDVLINNAGVVTDRGAAFETPDGDWTEMLSTNLRGVANCLRAVVPGMAARDRGHIVNLGSFAGLYPVPGLPLYSASKAAIHNLSQSLRLDLFGRRVRVTEICPGRVKTGIHTARFEDKDKADEVFYQGYECLAPEDVAETILFALEVPGHVDPTHIEIMPTLQVNGGVRYFKNGG